MKLTKQGREQQRRIMDELVRLALGDLIQMGQPVTEENRHLVASRLRTSIRRTRRGAQISYVLGVPIINRAYHRTVEMSSEYDISK